MVTIYKLTDERMQTHGGFQWELGKPAPELREGKACSEHAYHWYADLLLAVFLNPIHANFKNPRLFRGLGKQTGTDGLKCWGTTCTIIEELPLPHVTLNQCVAFGILVSLEVPQSDAYKQWATNWLNGNDRGATAARATAWAAEAAKNATINLSALAEKAMAI